MKSGRLLLTIIGGWLLFFCVDSAHARIAGRAVQALAKPVGGVFTVTKTVRGMLLLMLAVTTFFLMVKNTGNEEKLSVQGKEE